MFYRHVKVVRRHGQVYEMPWDFKIRGNCLSEGDKKKQFLKDTFPSRHLNVVRNLPRGDGEMLQLEAAAMGNCDGLHDYGRKWPDDLWKLLWSPHQTENSQDHVTTSEDVTLPESNHTAEVNKTHRCLEASVFALVIVWLLFFLLGSLIVTKMDQISSDCKNVIGGTKNIRGDIYNLYCAVVGGCPNH